MSPNFDPSAEASHLGISPWNLTLDGLPGLWVWDGHLEYRMQRIQRIWRYRDVGVRGLRGGAAAVRALATVGAAPSLQ